MGRVDIPAPTGSTDNDARRVVDGPNYPINKSISTPVPNHEGVVVGIDPGDFDPCAVVKRRI